jgi:RNA polymerase sigma-70 factor (ECF subfamily)
MTRDDPARWKRLTELLAPFHGAALGTARRLAGSAGDGDDLFQEAILRAHSRLDALRDEGRFRPWFFAILLSLHRSRSRRSFWRRFLPLSETVAQGREPAASPERGEDEWLRAQRASTALSRLPAVQREAIVLHDVEGFSVEEIAVMQEVSLSAVKSRLSRGRDRLRRFYLRRGWVQVGKGVAVKRSATGARTPLLATSTGTATSGEEV